MIDAIVAAKKLAELEGLTVDLRNLIEDKRKDAAMQASDEFNKFLYLISELPGPEREAVYALMLKLIWGKYKEKTFQDVDNDARYISLPTEDRDGLITSAATILGFESSGGIGELLWNAHEHFLKSLTPEQMEELIAEHRMNEITADDTEVENLQGPHPADHPMVRRETNMLILQFAIFGEGTANVQFNADSHLIVDIENLEGKKVLFKRVVSRTMYDAILSRIKIMAEIYEETTHKPLEGKIQFRLNDKILELDIMVHPGKGASPEWANIIFSYHKGSPGEPNPTDEAMAAKIKSNAFPGGIDLNQINVLRNGKTVNVQFDPAQLTQLEQGGFKGFTPVIINMTRITSPFQLLGIKEPETKELLAKA